MTREELLAAQDATAIFGPTATESRRALRKAYAQLVKVFSPEREPDCFRRIRDAYEQLNANFELQPTFTLAAEAGVLAVPMNENASEGEPVAAEDAPRETHRDKARRLLDSCVAKLKAGEVLAALSALDAGGALVRPFFPREWVQVTCDALDVVAFELPVSRLERAFDDLDDLSLEISEAQYWASCSTLTSALAWSAAKDDEALPPPFRRALIQSRSSERVQLAQLWFETLESLGSEQFSSAYRHVVVRHPGLLPLFYRIEEQVTGIATFTSSWEFSDSDLHFPSIPTHDVEALRRLRELVWKERRSGYRRPPLSASGRLVMAAALCLFGLLYMGKFRPLLGALDLVLAAGLLVLAYVKRRSSTERSAAEVDLRDGCLRLVRSGLFRHEVLAAVVGKRPSERVTVADGFYEVADVDPLVDFERDPASGLALLCQAQLDRIGVEEAARTAREIAG